MDLENLLLHKRNTKVMVNGTIYEINQDGIAHNVSDADAQKLLADTARPWRRHVKRSPVAAPAATPAPAPVVAAPVVAATVAEAQPAPAPVAAPEAAAAAPAVEQEWPNPDESMDIDYLRKMADAYDVKWTPKVNKAKLVALIEKAMYA